MIIKRATNSNVEAGVYDIVLLDFNIPILNVFQPYTELRRIDDKVRICFITASDDVGLSNLCTEISQSVTVGCFIQKHIEYHELLRRIKAELRK